MTGVITCIAFSPDLITQYSLSVTHPTAFEIDQSGLELLERVGLAQTLNGEVAAAVKLDELRNEL